VNGTSVTVSIVNPDPSFGLIVNCALNGPPVRFSLFELKFICISYVPAFVLELPAATLHNVVISVVPSNTLVIVGVIDEPV
jgi:hypothetical protein